MKKYYKIDILLKQKDESQIPEKVKKALEDPNSKDYFEYLGTVFQDGEELPDIVNGTFAVESEDELAHIIDKLLSDYKREYFDITINKEECFVQKLIKEEEDLLKYRIINDYMKARNEYYEKLYVRDYNALLREPTDDLYYAALVEAREKSYHKNDKEA